MYSKGTNLPPPQKDTVYTTPIHKDGFFHRHMVAEFISILMVAMAASVIYNIYLSIPPVTERIVHHEKKALPDWKINSYSSCIAAGYPMMKSYPAKCAGPDGVTFIQPLGACIQVIQPAKNPKTGEIRDFPTPCDVPEGWQAEEDIPGADAVIPSSDPNIPG
jgi:hypothetical protein